MQSVAGAQRLLASQQSGVVSRPRHQLVAFTGFKTASAITLGTGHSRSTLQAHVSKAINSAARRNGVKCMRVTRMMFERFTEKAIKVVMLAQEEARRLGHNFVGTEQILLGLIGESTGERCRLAAGLRPTGSNVFLSGLPRPPGRSRPVRKALAPPSTHIICFLLHPLIPCFLPHSRQASPPKFSNPWASP